MNLLAAVKELPLFLTDKNMLSKYRKLTSTKIFIHFCVLSNPFRYLHHTFTIFDTFLLVTTQQVFDQCWAVSINLIYLWLAFAVAFPCRQLQTVKKPQSNSLCKNFGVGLDHSIERVFLPKTISATIISYLGIAVFEKDVCTNVRVKHIL